MDTTIWIVIAVVAALIVLGLLLWAGRRKRHTRLHGEAEQIREEVGSGVGQRRPGGKLWPRRPPRRRVPPGRRPKPRTPKRRDSRSAARTHRQAAAASRDELDARLDHADEIDPKVKVGEQADAEVAPEARSRWNSRADRSAHGRGGRRTGRTELDGKRRPAAQDTGAPRTPVPAGFGAGKRSKNVLRPTSPSARASAAPRQKCRPPEKARWRAALARRTSNR